MVEEEENAQAESAARQRDAAGFVGRIRSVQTYHADVMRVNCDAPGRVAF